MQSEDLTIFTIVTRDYAQFARNWVNTVAALHPEACVSVAFADRPSTDLISQFQDCQVIDVQSDANDLGIANYQRMAFQYTPFELTCALKPFIARKLIRNSRRVIYLDADTWVQGRFDGVLERLESHCILLTPHLTQPYSAGEEQRVRQSGTLNGGFVALSKSPTSYSFLEWWSQRCRYDSCVDPFGGRFVDQTWLDLVPSLFDRVLVDRDPTLNVAYWNLGERPLGLREGKFHVFGRPLIFFHFSGFDLEQPNSLSRFTKNALVGANQELLRQFAENLESCKLTGARDLQCAFLNFNTGLPIDAFFREAIRTNHPAAARFEDPFDLDANPDLIETLNGIRHEMVLSRKHWQLEELQAAADRQTEWIQKHHRRRLSSRIGRMLRNTLNYFRRDAA